MTMWPIVGNGNSGQCSEFSVQSEFLLDIIKTIRLSLTNTMVLLKS
jgi:hypothetical protein